MRAAKVQASLRIRAVSPEPPLLVHTSSESRGTFRQKARSLAPLNGWACAVKICHDGMLEDTSSLDASHLITATSTCYYRGSAVSQSRKVLQVTFTRANNFHRCTYFGPTRFINIGMNLIFVDFIDVFSPANHS